MALPKYDSDIPEGHAFAETRNMRPRDQYLRRNGFHIVSRPNEGEAIWEYRGKQMPESEAIIACDEASSKANE